MDHAISMPDAVPIVDWLRNAHVKLVHFAASFQSAIEGLEFSDTEDLACIYMRARALRMRSCSLAARLPRALGWLRIEISVDTLKMEITWTTISAWIRSNWK